MSVSGQSWIRGAGIVGYLVAVILLQACPCPQSPPTQTSNSIGTPTPGPIIDTGGGPGTELTYTYDEKTITPIIADTDRVDDQLRGKVLTAVLVDTQGVTNGKLRSVFVLANGVVATYT